MAEPAPYYDFTGILEGGFSNDPRDTGPAKNPAPCDAYDPIKKKTIKKPHTYRGIIYTTFQEIAPLVGIAATCQRFVNMSHDDWKKIFNEIWRRAGAYEINNQALANLIFKSRWGTGPGAIHQLSAWMKEYTGVKVNNWFALAALINKFSTTGEETKKLFTFLWNKRYKFLEDLADRKHPEYKNGWLNGWKKFFAFNDQWLTPGSPVAFVPAPAPADEAEGRESDPDEDNTEQRRRRNRNIAIVSGTGALLLGTTIYILHRRRKRKLIPIAA